MTAPPKPSRNAAGAHDLSVVVEVDADQRDRKADERDRAADLRDEAGDARDEAADARDTASDRRDDQAVSRDDDADRRDALAVRQEDRDAGSSDPAAASASATARVHASSDRRHSAEDRTSGAGSRGAAKDDRREAKADRAEGAADRRQEADDRALASVEREAASQDVLTGAYLRGVGLGQFEQELARAHRTDQLLTVAFLDVDGLKAVNDSQGHPAGDQLLRRVVAALRDHLRPYDLVVRYGGDEFVCVMSGIAQDEAEERFAQVNADLGETGSVTVGVVTAEKGEDSAALIRRADAALYARRADVTGQRVINE